MIFIKRLKGYILVPALHRNASLIIDKSAIFDNILNAKKRLKPKDDLFVVVKANGYGHGAIEIAKIARKAGATGFCVALLDEALQLRHSGVQEPILVLGITDPAYSSIAAQENISLTVGSIDWLNQATDELKQNPSLPPLKIHLALDTGMGRIGFQKKEEVKSAAKKINIASALTLEGLFTHFATADSKDFTQFEHQYALFRDLISVVNPKPRYVHAANSATGLWHQIEHVNMMRQGISAYGLNPSGATIPQTPYKLEPALSLKSELVHIKQVDRGTTIGYGATYRATDKEWIGTVPIGYADGIPRKLQGFSILIDGIRCPIVGRICMDQFMVKLPEKFKYGTPVTIIGVSGNQTITVDDLAAYVGTINYEIICGLSDRLKRIYI